MDGSITLKTERGGELLEILAHEIDSVMDGFVVLRSGRTFLVQESRDEINALIKSVKRFSFTDFFPTDESQIAREEDHPEGKETTPGYLSPSVLKKENDEFKAVCQPVVDYLYEHGCPHTTVIIDQTHAELLDGRMSTVYVSRD